VSIQATLEHYGVRSIWHFTDISNIQSIENNGLLSLRNLINNKINVACYGQIKLSFRFMI